MGFRSFYPRPYVGANLIVLQGIGVLAGHDSLEVTEVRGNNSWGVTWSDGSNGIINYLDVQYLAAVRSKELQPVRVGVVHSFFVRVVEDGRKVYNILPTGETWNGAGYYDPEYILKLKGYDPRLKNYFTSVG